MITFVSPKGGSGTTVTAVATAVHLAGQHGQALLVDLCGDVPAAAGISEPTGPGVGDWLNDSTADAEALVLSSTATDGSLLVCHAGAPVAPDARWSALAEALSAMPMPVVVDAGTARLDPAMRRASTTVWTVVRPCYLALRRAVTMPRPDGAVLLEETGRALTHSDVASVLGVPVVARIPVDPVVSRAVDAGLLVSRAGRLLGRHVAALQPA
jgi:hypothetical protein